MSFAPRPFEGIRAGGTSGILNANIVLSDEGGKCSTPSYGLKTAVEDTNQALSYLEGSWHAREFLSRVNKAPVPLTILVNLCDKNEVIDMDVPSTVVIAWDPRQALTTSEGKKQSPALGLIHELAHAMHQIEDPELTYYLRSEACGAYDYCEERRTILYAENVVARELGEEERHDHRGDDNKVASPIDVE